MTQEEIQQIREEQQRQYDAPTKLGKKLLQTFSNVFHPLLMLTYAALVICAFTSLSVLPFALKAYFVGKVFFYTVLLPVLAITLMHVFHRVGHWALRDRRDRMLPFTVNFISYSLNAYSLWSDGFLPNWVLMFYYGSVILTFVALIVSFWWKISAHASADAAFATMALITYFYFPETMPLWLSLCSIVIVGAVCSIRIYLGRHTLAQVSWGALLGVFSMSTGMALWG